MLLRSLDWADVETGPAHSENSYRPIGVLSKKQGSWMPIDTGGYHILLHIIHSQSIDFNFNVDLAMIFNCGFTQKRVERVV